MTTPDDHAAIEVYRFDSLDSTSLHARREVESGSASILTPRLYVSKTQTSGRGQRGRPWASPIGGLWCTFLVPWTSPWTRGDLRGNSIGTLGVRTGLACVSAVYDILRGDRASVSISLKLPNDVLVHSKKIAGILTEMVSVPQSDSSSPAAGPRTFVLIGVGINANFMPNDLPPAIAPDATTLRAVSGREIDLQRLQNTLVHMMLPALDTRLLEPSELVAVRACLHARGRPARVVTPAGLLVEGKLEGVDSSGAVIVSTPTGTAAGILEPLY